MVISDRCRDVNLLNHLKQLKKPVSVNFIQIKDISDKTKLVEKIINIDDFKSNHPNWIEYLNKLLWVCTLTIGSKIFKAQEKKKRMCFVIFFVKNTMNSGIYLIQKM